MNDHRSEFQRRIGVGEQQHLFGRHVGTAKVTPVVGDNGPLAGKTVGAQKEHWSGRVDAKVTAATTTLSPNVIGVRDERGRQHLALPRKVGA